MGRGRDLERRDEWRESLAQMCREGEGRIRQDVARFEALGIIDAEGNLIHKELPPDMQPGAVTDHDYYP